MTPTLFLSHGAPTLALDATPAQRFLRGLAAQLPAPRAIVVVSAHWQTETPMVTGVAEPETIHDFYGFPPALYQLRYPAVGDPALAVDIAERLRASGHPAVVDTRRGLDHGAWVPLLLAWPEARIPVLQVSLLNRGDARAHFALGQALAPLRDSGVLIIGSGGLTHNLRAFRGQPVDAEVPEWVIEFAEWMTDGLKAGRTEGLLAWERYAPQAAENHPSHEHLMPIFVAMGAAGAGAVARPLHRGYEFGVLAMDAWRFD